MDKQILEILSRFKKDTQDLKTDMQEIKGTVQRIEVRQAKIIECLKTK